VHFSSTVLENTSGQELVHRPFFEGTQSQQLILPFLQGHVFAQVPLAPQGQHGNFSECDIGCFDTIHPSVCVSYDVK